MKDASQYPVTFPFGATTAPYSIASPHQGDDHAMPTGTKIIVNGTLVALSGASGLGVTGPHLHIGHYINAVAVNPNGQGFNLKSPVTVYDCSSTVRDGNYVRLLDGDGTIWLYDHCSKNDIVTKGQKIGGTVSASQDKVDETTVRLEYNNALVRDASQDEVNARVSSGQTVEELQRDIQGSAEHEEVLRLYELGKQAEAEKWGPSNGNFQPVGPLYTKK